MEEKKDKEGKGRKRGEGGRERGMKESSPFPWFFCLQMKYAFPPSILQLVFLGQFLHPSISLCFPLSHHSSLYFIFVLCVSSLPQLLMAQTPLTYF